VLYTLIYRDLYAKQNLVLEIQPNDADSISPLTIPWQPHKAGCPLVSNPPNKVLMPKGRTPPGSIDDMTLIKQVESAKGFIFAALAEGVVKWKNRKNQIAMMQDLSEAETYLGLLPVSSKALHQFL